MGKRALVIGATGQLASYLMELLLDKGYKVFGLMRRQSNENLCNINHLLDKITLLHGDITDEISLTDIITQSKPDEIYNTAAQSHVKVSWEQPILTSDINSIGCVKLLETIRKINKNIKVLQFSSSEMYGDVLEIPQTERTPLNPRSPYAVSKVFSYFMFRTYRFSYNMFACNTINFNTESPRRGKEFVTRKITMGVAKIKLDSKDKIRLGNLDAKRDWTHAKDIVRGVYAIMQRNEPDDFVLCSGTTHSIREFLTEAFNVIGIDDWTPYVEVDPQFMRPAEVNLLLGDHTKATTVLGWSPTISFKELVKEMVENDVKLLQKHLK